VKERPDWCKKAECPLWDETRGCSLENTTRHQLQGLGKKVFNRETARLQTLADNDPKEVQARCLRNI